MNLAEFQTLLNAHPDKTLRLTLPDGRAVAAEFHVTEVGHVTKRFIDCGGTVRSVESVTLQTWVAENDAAHRLTAGKLAKIIGLAAPVLPTHDLPVEIEHEDAVISQYPVSGHSMEGDTLVFTLGVKHTDCLAKELCCPPALAVKIGAPVSAAENTGCGCGPKGCC
jgi:hypothetical protein